MHGCRTFGLPSFLLTAASPLLIGNAGILLTQPVIVQGVDIGLTLQLLLDQLTTLTGRVTAAEAAVHDMQVTNATWTQLSAAVAQLDNATAALQLEHRANVLLQMQVSNLTLQLSTAQSSIASQATQIMDVQSALQSLVSSQETLLSAAVSNITWLTAASSAQAAVVKELVSSSNSRAAQIASASNNITALQVTVSDQAALLATANTSIASNAAEIARTNGAVATNTASITTLASNVAAIQSNLSGILLRLELRVNDIETLSGASTLVATIAPAGTVERCSTE